MKSFDIKTRIYFGDQALDRLTEIPYEKVLIVTDPFIAQGKMIDLVTGPLQRGGKQFEIFKDENGAFVVVGGLVDMLCRNVVLSNPDSMAYFQRTLKNRGVFKALEKAGCAAGDTVVVGEVEFDYIV